MNGVAQIAEARCRLFLDPGTPEIDIHFGVGGRRQAGQAFAHHEGHGLFKRRIPAVAGAVDHGLGKAVFQGGIQVLRHARHGVGAQRLNAGLLHGFKHGAGVLSLGPVLAVNLVRVIGDA